MKPDNDPRQQTPRAPTFKEVYKQGQIAFRDRNFEQAISISRQILEVSPDSIPAFGLLAKSLRRSGGIGQEIAALKSAIDSGGDTPGLYGKLGELQRVAGDYADAIASLEHAAAVDPDGPVTRFRLALAHFGNDDHAAAAREFGRVLEIDPRSAPAHYYLGEIYLRAKNWREARQAFSAALEVNANYLPACRGLAKLLFSQDKSEDRTGDLEQAYDLIQRAIGHGADNLNSHILAGKILIELERFEEARKTLESADAAFPKKNPDLYVALSVAYWRLGKHKRARDVSRRLLREFPVGSRRCANAQAEVLVLETLRGGIFKLPLYGLAAYAHANTISTLPADRVSLHHVFIEGINEEQLESYKSKYNVIFNNAANAETNSLLGYGKAVQKVMDGTGLPVINAPDLIDLTARDKNYERLHKLDHLIFPKTVAFSLSADGAAGMIERVEEEFEYPVLVRRADTHQATTLEKIDDTDALRQSLKRYAKGSLYIIQYHESSHPSGNFLMYRGVFIDGKFYPGRMYLADSWLVSGPELNKLSQTPIGASSEFQDEEKRWLADPAGVLGQANLDALYAADRVIKLDCYGMDFGLAEDGRVIVFEANACMICLAILNHVEKFPYLRQAAENMQTALEDLLIDRANGRSVGPASIGGMKPGNDPRQQAARAPTVREVYKQGQTAFRNGNFERAISISRRVLEVRPDSTPAFDLLAQSLRRSGGIGQEIAALKSAIDSGGDTPGLYGKLGELQRVAGDHAGAIASLEHAAAVDPDGPVTRFRLAMAHFDIGDHAQAATEFRRVLEIDPRFALAYFYLGEIFLRAEEWREARQAFSAALEADANFLPARYELANLLFHDNESEDRSGDLEQAYDLIQRAIGHGADKLNNYLLAGKILIELERVEEAKDILETAAAAFPEKPADLYVALSLAYWRLGENDTARAVSRRHLREFPVGSHHCANAEAEVLVLETLRDGFFKRPLYGLRAYAHTNTIAALPADRVSRHHVFLEGIEEDQLESCKSKYNVIFNNAANAETNSIVGYGKIVQKVLDRTGLPVVNAPDLIDLTTRDNNYERLHKLDHLIFPKTVAFEVSADSAAGIAERVEEAFVFPVLVRPTGTHAADELEKVDDIDALRKALARISSGPYYVIQYHESKHPSGYFLRYRCAFIGGVLYPGHLYLNDNWLISGPVQLRLGKPLIENNEEVQGEEQRWLADPADVIGQANLDALHAVNDVIKLDCYGADIGMAEDGRVIVFEVNACMNSFSIRHYIPKFPYLKRSEEDIQLALENLLIDKAKGRA